MRCHPRRVARMVVRERLAGRWSVSNRFLGRGDTDFPIACAAASRATGRRRGAGPSVDANGPASDAGDAAPAAFRWDEALGRFGEHAAQAPFVRTLSAGEHSVDGGELDLVDAIAAAEIDGFQLGHHQLQI